MNELKFVDIVLDLMANGYKRAKHTLVDYPSDKDHKLLLIPNARILAELLHLWVDGVEVEIWEKFERGLFKLGDSFWNWQFAYMVERANAKKLYVKMKIS